MMMSRAWVCLFALDGVGQGWGFQLPKGWDTATRLSPNDDNGVFSWLKNTNADDMPTNQPSRRHFFDAVASAAFVAAVPNAAWATPTVGESTVMLVLDPPVVEAVETLPMKTFVDPQGLFSIDVPEGFFTLRRKTKGDLPDAQGKGRRGSSIFTAGNMAKAEVVAVERFPTRVLLEENGIEATGSLATFTDIGEPSVVASLINLRREKDKPGLSNTVLDPASVTLSSDGKELTFQLRAEIDVQKPELLLEEYGVDRLFRVTVAKASLNSNDGNLMAVFASALETDFKSMDGVALRKSVDSFRVTEREFGF